MNVFITTVTMVLSALSETVTMNPMEDTYTTPAGGCHGYESELLSANMSSAGHPDERIMLLWDLSEYSGREVISASIKLNVFFQCGSGSGTNTNLHAIAESWDESWAGTHTQVESSPSGEYFFLGTGWHEICVTPLVERWLSGEIPNHGVSFIVNGVYPYTKCYSRETQHSPVLEIVFAENQLTPSSWAGIKYTLQE